MVDVRRIITYAGGTRCHAEAIISGCGTRFINFAISGTESPDELKEMAHREARECEMAMARE